MKNENTFDICYIIKTAEAISDKTFFFNIEKNKVDKVKIIEFITKLPINIFYLSITPEEKIESKLTGTTNGYVIRFIREWDEITEIPYKIKVIFSDSTPPSHLTNLAHLISDSEILDHVKVTENIYDHISKVMKIDKKTSQTMMPVNSFSVNKDTYSHSTLLSLESNDYTFNYNEKNNNNEKILQLHTNIVNYVCRQINNGDIKYLNKFSYILTDFSIDSYFIEHKKELSKSNLRKQNQEQCEADSIYNSIVLAKNSIVNGDIENIHFQDYISEINYIDTLIGVYSCSTFSPTLKSDCYINDVYNEMSELAKLERSNKYNEKVKLLSKKISYKLTENSKNIIYHLEQSAIHPIKIISNLPLEWIRSNKLPLMINSPVSRIPKTPFYLMERLTLENNYNITLSYSSLFEILVIRSYKENDELKNQLSNYINKTLLMFKQELLPLAETTSTIQNNKIKNRNFKITIKDINEPDELIEALNKSTENIVIFDMHGGHSENGEGFLKLNNNVVTISSLHDKIKRIPPIVILSSCDTSSIDRNSFNISAGFLLLGVRSVLGSALPINGHESARFISRLLIRINLYLPERLSKYDTIRWHNFIHGMQKREYFLDLINHLYNKRIIKSAEEKFNITNKVGLFIENYFHSDLLDQILKIISKITNNREDFISREIEDNFFFAESIKYFHLGIPENILVVSDERYNEIQSMKD
ncbi:hypothetical protein IW01_07580 [Pectobacterium brasiliense]|uniref:CHAT domain-containing protein n=1 Tax=Pectobacterium brasiliense TaxID=180957 RepID=UPI0004E6229C|nr:CHAT domain-containing protein [Pectobacterium brasiliense]KFF71786.1 hypothetical protein IW01_07580 [Pectobacterium brasiliense]